MRRRISELKRFPGQDLLMASQKRGEEIMDSPDPDAVTSTLIGLADILYEIPSIRDSLNAAITKELADKNPKI